MFRGKTGGKRVQGILTWGGGEKLKEHKRDLAALYERVHGRKPKVVSDADVIEYLARGKEDTEQQLRRYAKS